MLTVFLKTLLCIWTRLMMCPDVAFNAVEKHVERNFCRFFAPLGDPVPGLFQGGFGFERHMNLRLCTGKYDFSLHSGLCENSPINWQQANFRRPMNPPLFGDLWPLQRTCIEAGTV